MVDASSLRNELVSRSPVPPLFPARRYRDDLAAVIAALSAPPLVRAGLHLWNDDIESCHAIAQENEGPDGNYWHAILHRREGDIGNSGYWYRRVGRHPVILQMRREEPDWSPEAFLELCEDARRRGSRLPDAQKARLEGLQALEMRLLLDAVL